MKSGKDLRLCKQDSTDTEQTEAFGYEYLSEPQETKLPIEIRGAHWQR